MFSQFVFVLKIKIKWSLWPFPLHEISVLIELTLGHLCYRLTDVPPQPNSPPDVVSHAARPPKGLQSKNRTRTREGPPGAAPWNK